MKRVLLSAAVGCLAMLAACEPANGAVPDDQANYADSDGNEMPAHQMSPAPGNLGPNMSNMAP